MIKFVAHTALLRKLKANSSGDLVLNLNVALKQVLPSETVNLLAALRHAAEQQNMPLYVVGGFVRDLLLGRPHLDFDLVVEGNAIALGRQFVKKFGGRLLPHKAFGTAVWTLDKKAAARKLHGSQQLPEFIDLISARRESYSRPGALPDVDFADIHADQYRRDFTINTLALRLDDPQPGLLLDPFGAVKDLRQGLIRVLHSKSFADDPTRVLRAIRLAGRLGFKLEASTLRQLKSSLHHLNSVSGERIRTELELILSEPKRTPILQATQKLGVLVAIYPKLHFDGKLAKKIDHSLSPAPAYWTTEAFSPAQLAFVFWLMNFVDSDVLAIAERLQLDSKLRIASTAAVRLYAERARLQSMRPSELVDKLEKMPMLAVYALFLSSRNKKLGTLLQRYAQKWRHVRPHIDGNTLRRRGLNPGPAYKQILHRLRSAWLDGEIKTTRQEQALLEKLIDDHY